MAHNTIYHASLECFPTEIFHVRTPHSARDLKFANPVRATRQPRDISKMLNEINQKHDENVNNIVAASKTENETPVRNGVVWGSNKNILPENRRLSSNFGLTKL